MNKIVLLILLVKTVLAQSDYDYTSVIRASAEFYKIQRSGRLPDNDIPWRGDSFLDDGSDVSHDLSGGYFDAGDHVKFMFPHAYFTTMINWGLIDWTDGYEESALPGALQTVRWSLDFLMKTHAEPNLIFGQIGDGHVDHSFWGRPEDWPYGPRPTFNISSASCGSELAAEYAAAFASGFLVFRERDPSYANQLLQHARDAYEFAYTCRGNYTNSVPAADFYASWSGYADELGWGALWLLRATNDQLYKSRADSLWNEFGYQGINPVEFSWDNKYVGIFIIGAKTTGEQKYLDKGIQTCDDFLDNYPRTPKGLIFLGPWGSLRSAATVSFACVTLAQLDVPRAEDYRDFAKQQIGYILGDTGRSYVVGWGVNPPQSPHHRAGSCPPRPQECNDDNLNTAQPNYFTLTGALVGGPDENDFYEDIRTDYVHNEVACDYNAGFQSCLAALQSLRIKDSNSAGIKNMFSWNVLIWLSLLFKIMI